MSFNSQLADFVSRLNIASRSHFISVFVNRSNLIINILKVLHINGLIIGFSIFNNSILINLKYNNGISIFSSLTLISRPVNEYIED